MQYIKDWKVSYVCDRCKDIFEYSPIVFTMNNDRMDLCKDCMRSLKQWFKSPGITTVDGKSYYTVIRDNKLVLERPFKEPVAFDTKQELIEYLRQEPSPCRKCTPSERAACTGCPDYEIWRSKNESPKSV